MGTMSQIFARRLGRIASGRVLGGVATLVRAAGSPRLPRAVAIAPRGEE